MRDCWKSSEFCGEVPGATQSGTLCRVREKLTRSFVKKNRVAHTPRWSMLARDCRCLFRIVGRLPASFPAHL